MKTILTIVIIKNGKNKIYNIFTEFNATNCSGDTFHCICIDFLKFSSNAVVLLGLEMPKSQLLNKTEIFENLWPLGGVPNYLSRHGIKSKGCINIVNIFHKLEEIINFFEGDPSDFWLDHVSFFFTSFLIQNFYFLL